jgi:hypothetical protein
MEMRRLVLMVVMGKRYEISSNTKGTAVRLQNETVDGFSINSRICAASYNDNGMPPLS